MEAESRWAGGQPVRDPACHTKEGGPDAKGHRHRTGKDGLLLQGGNRGPESTGLTSCPQPPPGELG